MKIVKSIISIVLLSVVLAGCNESNNEVSNTTGQPAEESQDSVVLSQEEMADKTEKLISTLISPEDIGLQLNSGEKWLLDGESLKKILQLKQQIYVISGNMENYETPSYNMLGDEILEFLKTVPTLENDQANAEYQKVVKETKNQCMFLIGSSKQEAQVAVINLSILYDEVPKYFVSAEI